MASHGTSSTAGVLPQLPLETCIPILDSAIAGDKRQPDGSAGLGRGWAGSSQLNCSWLESLALHGVDYGDFRLYQKLEHIAVHGELPRPDDDKGGNGKQQTALPVKDAAMHCTERYRLLNTVDKLALPLQAILVGGDGLAHSNISITLDLPFLCWDDCIDGSAPEVADHPVPGLPEYTFGTVGQQPIGVINERLASLPLTHRSLATALYLQALLLLPPPNFLAPKKSASAVTIDITSGAINAMRAAVSKRDQVSGRELGVVLLAAAWLVASPNLTRLRVRAEPQYEPDEENTDIWGSGMLTCLFVLVAKIEAITGLTICPNLATLSIRRCDTQFPGHLASLYFLKPMLDTSRRQYLSAVEVDCGGYNGVWRLSSDSLPARELRDLPGSSAPDPIGGGEREDEWISREVRGFWWLLGLSRGYPVQSYPTDRTSGRPSDTRLVIRRGAVAATLPLKPRPFSADPGDDGFTWSEYCLLHPEMEELCLDILPNPDLFGDAGRLTALPRLRRLHTLSISLQGLWGQPSKFDEHDVDIADDPLDENMQFDRGTGIHQLLPPNIKHLTLIATCGFRIDGDNSGCDRLLRRTILSILADREADNKLASLQTISVIHHTESKSWRVALQNANEPTLNLEVLENKCRSLGIVADFDRAWQDPVPFVG